MRRPLHLRARGFTLLEVLVAVSILGLGLTAILSAQAGAFSSASHARAISVATGLLRCKMSEVEEHLYKDGFQETDETGAGPCCDGDENPNMRCTWRIDRPTFPEAKFGDLNLGAGLDLAGGAQGGTPNPLGGALGLLGGAASGSSPLAGASSLTDVAKTLADANSGAAAAAPSLSSSSGSGASASGGDPGMGGLASMAMSFVYPSLKILFEASTRRITTTLTFRQGKKDYSIDVVEWFCVPQKGLAVDDPNAVDSSSSSSSGGNRRKDGGT
jgi:general secretion pathway protein I